ncbi:hypothetical protein [Chryseobacterium sp. ERMR1:04]|uniref:hypothetical protein n=1 Tax=Chryseobacterium sp. ERMR1:04 TaxID=1705393 RepID=UPI0006C84A52|nr:hypothetical protein [Chryseobacterium sp. ERMR1:04]KPH14866.1 hypothetical protein AMQ68_05425 [Chryseobacterium sp. ERMR1:04]
MARFIVRVELYGSEDADYDDLHEIMIENKFLKTIKSDKNTYHLPRGQYHLYEKLLNEENEIIDDETEVARIAKNLVETVWTDFGLIVSKVDGPIKMHNLKIVK